MILHDKRILFVASVLVLIFAGGLLKSCLYQIPFNSQQWKSAEYSDYTDETRQRMLRSLIRKHRLLGMKKEQVLDLLGPESDPAYFAEYDLRYWLGPEHSWMALDSE